DRALFAGAAARGPQDVPQGGGELLHLEGVAQPARDLAGEASRDPAEIAGEVEWEEEWKRRPRRAASRQDARAMTPLAVRSRGEPAVNSSHSPRLRPDVRLTRLMMAATV